TYADYTPLGYGSSCHGLDANENISYAFNVYYQTQYQKLEACNFRGLAKLTTQNISTGNCNLTIQIASSGLRTAAPAAFLLNVVLIYLFF
ncbi:hypothetical protein SOVF_214250, partial [Spinacia oleracea]